MGVDGSHRSFSFMLHRVSIEDLVSIARVRSRERNESRRPANIPVIDIDASWIIRKGNGSIEHRIEVLLNLSTYLARLGLQVLIVCDGSKRHHSKRATTKRLADCYRNNISYHSNRMKLSLLTTEKEECIEVTKRNELENQINVLSKATLRSKNAATKSQINVGDELFHALQQGITELTEKEIGDRQGKISVVQGEFQADSVIAARINRKENDLAICSDSDMNVLTGQDCMCIKEYKFKDKGMVGSIMHEIDIFCAWKSTINKAIDILNLPNDSTRIFIPPYPIFDIIDDMRLRSLFAVGIGCDVIVGGIPGVTPKFIHDNLKRYVSLETTNHLKPS